MNISSKDYTHNENSVYYFKKDYCIEDTENSVINVFAQTRYKLYINDRLVAVGPCKSASSVKYYDEVDISQYLVRGKNTVEVTVLQLANKPLRDSYMLLESVIRNGEMFLAIWGNAGETKIETDESWLVAKEEGIEFFYKPEYRAYNVAALCEKVSQSYRKLRFENAVAAGTLYNMEDNSTYSLCIENPVNRRNIPMMFFKYKDFVGQKNGVFDAGELTCGYFRLKCKGRGRVRLTYAECMSFRENGEVIKRKRDDETGSVIGDYDIIEVNGECFFEPFWMRTFRYVKADIEGEVAIENIDYIETGYPIKISEDYNFGNELDNRLFEISTNTLRRCMHETYVDCPYYEQLQYTMDTHLQMLFTYQLTQDKRLAEKAIDDFAQSYRAGGLTQSRYPVITSQYIPGFSLFFIMMLYEHMKRFGNKDFIKKYIPVADGIVDWFIKRLDGYMVSKSNLWDFIDWSEGYKKDGMTSSGGPIAVYSLMLAYVLEKLSEIHTRLGRSIPEYIILSENIKKDVKNRCFDTGKGLYADSPKKLHFVQHTQIWAVICGMETGNNAKEILTRSMQSDGTVSLAYMFFLFRAFEKADMYHLSSKYIELLKSLISLSCTTTPEILGENARSECHAWSAVAIYEFTAKVLGVTYKYNTIYIEPYIAGRSMAKGEVATPGGVVYVEWKTVDDVFSILINTPENAKTVLIMPDKSEINAKSGEYYCKLPNSTSNFE